MKKYINAEKLIAEINNRLMAVNLEELRNFGSHRIWAYNDVKDIIDSLQQEQPETSNNLVDVDAVREDFIAEVYRVLDADPTNDRANAIIDAFDSLPTISLEQPDMIQWTGKNLKEVIDFTGKSPKFGEWFNSWEEFETYVHQHNDILKLFCEDGSHYEVPIGAWIVKTPDGYNVPSVAKHIQQERPEVQDGRFVFPKYLYARSKDNKTIDISYAPQDMTAVEYVRNNFVEQEQPEISSGEEVMTM